MRRRATSRTWRGTELSTYTGDRAVAHVAGAFTARFDRIISVEMIEHVGRKHLPDFFAKCDELMVDDGVMVIQSIGCAIWKVMVGKSFIEKYIFPGCEPPQQTDFADVASRWHLEDWQGFGKDYARTMRLWCANLKNWEGLEEFDDRFRRMWEYYLLSCAGSFDRRRTKVWQLVYTKTASHRPRDCHHVRGVDPRVFDAEPKEPVVA